MDDLCPDCRSCHFGGAVRLAGERRGGRTAVLDLRPAAAARPLLQPVARCATDAVPADRVVAGAAICGNDQGRRVRRNLNNDAVDHGVLRSEEHTSELRSLMRISYAVFCLKKKNNTSNIERRL